MENIYDQAIADDTYVNTNIVGGVVNYGRKVGKMAGEIVK